MKRQISLFIIFCIFMSYFTVPVKADDTDVFLNMRKKWFNMIAGYEVNDISDTHIKTAADKIAAEASALWDEMEKGDDRKYLWVSGKPTSGDGLYSCYGKLFTMAKAYATNGSSLYKNKEMLSDILDGLEWLDENNYYSASASSWGNWWQWQIGIPEELNDIVILLYDEIPKERREKYMAAIEHFQPDIAMSGANRMWECEIFAVRAIISENPALLDEVKKGLSMIIGKVRSGDGFYEDGSFIQHTSFPYTGGYGASLIESLSKIMYIIDGTQWEINEAAKNNIYEFIKNAYAPLIYKGAFMDMARGREIARYYADTYYIGKKVMFSLMKIAEVSEDKEQSDIYSMIKYWVDENDYTDICADSEIFDITAIKRIMADDNITAMDEPIFYKQFAGMDRAVKTGENYGAAISMFSDRITNYESINSENGRAWNTADGMLYLYNGDLSQYSESFWPTINMHRLPGTTVLKDTDIKSSRSEASFAGGVTADGSYGVSGMRLMTPGKSLEANKSWFMFDDEIVALGSGIKSSDGISVETIADNRKLQSPNDTLNINGNEITQETKIDGAKWAHLSGEAKNSDIGYYFPFGQTINAMLETRSGSWRELAQSGTADIYTETYSTTWFDHGVNPSDEKYAYVILPGKSSDETISYAESPDIEVVSDTPSVHAVYEKNLNILGVNFFENKTSSAGGVTSSRQSSVIVKKDGGIITAAVSDPTQNNNEWIDIEIDAAASGVISSEENIVIKQLAPTIKFSVSTEGLLGRSVKVEFKTSDDVITEPSNDVYIVDNTDSGFECEGEWKSDNSAKEAYGIDFIHGSGSAIWRPYIKETDIYDVYIRTMYYANVCENVPVEVCHADGKDTDLYINERYSSGEWVKIGTYKFSAGTDGYIKISGGESDKITADAVKFVAHNAKGNSTDNKIYFAEPNPTADKEILYEDFENISPSFKDEIYDGTLYRRKYFINDSFNLTQTATSPAQGIKNINDSFIGHDEEGDGSRKYNNTNYFTTGEKSISGTYIGYNLERKISVSDIDAINPDGLLYVDMRVRKGKSNSFTVNFCSQNAINGETVKNSSLFAFEVSKYTPSLMFHYGKTKINSNKNFDFLEWEYVRSVIDLYNHKVYMYCGDSLDNLQPWEGFGTKSVYSFTNDLDDLSSIYLGGSGNPSIDDIHIYTVKAEDLPPKDFIVPQKEEYITVPVTVTGVVNGINYWDSAVYKYKEGSDYGYLSNGKYKFMYYPETGEIKNKEQSSSFSYEDGIYEGDIVIPSRIEPFFAQKEYDGKDIVMYASSGNNAIFRYNAFADTNIILSDGIKTIPSNVFAQCSTSIGAQKFIIPKSVTKICSGAFAQSSGGGIYREIVLPDGLKTIEKNAFVNTRFTKISIPSQVYEIPSSCFNGSKNLTDIVINCGGTIEEYAFNGCSSLSDIKFTSTTAPVVAANAFTSVADGCVVRYPSYGEGYDEAFFASFPSGVTFEEYTNPEITGIVTEGESVVGIKIVNSEVLGENAKTAVAVYDESGELVSFKMGSAVVDGVSKISAVPYYGDIKAFVWNENQVPLVEKYCAANNR
jgi:hyaluronate lyase